MVFYDVSLPVLRIVKVHLIINSVLVLLTLLVVGLRMLCRFESEARLWWDDYHILLAVPQGIGMLIIQGLWAPTGIGYPVTQTLPNLVPILKMLVAYEPVFACCISTIKMSVMFFYLRVFVNSGLRLAVKLVMAFVLLWSVGNVLQVFLICRPFAATYDPTIEVLETPLFHLQHEGAVCGNQVGTFIAIGAFNITTDAVILTLPVPTIWRLKMSGSARLGISVVLMIGLVVSVVAIIRIVSLTRLDMTNLTGTMIWADFWLTVEPNLGIFCVSLPMLGRLRSRFSSRRGASKFGPSEGSYRLETDASAARKQKGSRGHEDEDHALEAIYASNKEVHHQSSAVAAGHRGGGGKRDDTVPSRDGSEEALTDERDKNGILVQTKRTIESG
ncbi:hypothetical protein GE09DRAFT_1053967 [Coniochaeta sp. 2T2.1]|nr:hypothetical protein GE09DRAFT_1053967 [Coniochaeta sp. 2T2.1]